LKQGYNNFPNSGRIQNMRTTINQDGLNHQGMIGQNINSYSKPSSSQNDNGPFENLTFRNTNPQGMNINSAGPRDNQNNNMNQNYRTNTNN
jgi:hypothetical protein